MEDNMFKTISSAIISNKIISNKTIKNKIIKNKIIKKKQPIELIIVNEEDANANECIETSPLNYKLIDISIIDELPLDYPEEFNQFCTTNDIKPPNITTGNGKALSVMLKYKYCYWNRENCDIFVNKFGIITKDSIQLFNKHSQWGIQTNSGSERGKLYIVYPFCLSNKHKMRKNFKFNGTDEEKYIEIDKIKSTIKTDYVEVPNELWQLGHKNPGSTNNSADNLVLQPPIQGKYRDNYIFIDTLTKFPLASKLEKMIEKKEVEFTPEQIASYKILFEHLFKQIS